MSQLVTPCLLRVPGIHYLDVLNPAGRTLFLFLLWVLRIERMALFRLSTGYPTDMYSCLQGLHSKEDQLRPSMLAYTFSLKAPFLNLDCPDSPWDKLCNQTNLSFSWAWRRKPCSSRTQLLCFLPCRPLCALDPRVATRRQKHI